VALSAAEMNADLVYVRFHDAAGDEWQDALVVINTETGTISEIDINVDDLETRLGTPSNLGSGATVAANLVDIEVQTDDIGAAGAGLTAVPWNAAWDAEVQSEATDALNLYDPPTDAEMLVAVGAVAADVWDVAVPGGYPVGDAGYVLGHLDGLDITAVSPVLDDETIELYEGDSYYEADGRSLKWTDSGSTWPNITGATVTLLVRAPNGDQLSAAGVVSIGGGGPGQQVYVELSAAQTTAMVDWPKPSHFRLRVTLVSGHVVTLAAGTMTVHYDIA